MKPIATTPGPRLVVAIDGGLTHFGWARALVHHTDVVVVQAAGLIATERLPSAGKGLSVSRDNMRRARELADALADVFGLRGDGGQPGSLADVRLGEVDYVVMEAMSHAPSASSAGKLALALGVVACWSELMGASLVEVTPHEIKQVMGVKVTFQGDPVQALGSLAKKDRRGQNAALKRASKRRVQEAVEGRLYDECGKRLGDLLAEVPPSKREHPCDALAALYTAVELGRFPRRSPRGHQGTNGAG